MNAVEFAALYWRHRKIFTRHNTWCAALFVASAGDKGVTKSEVHRRLQRRMIAWDTVKSWEQQGMVRIERTRLPGGGVETRFFATDLMYEKLNLTKP